MGPANNDSEDGGLRSDKRASVKISQVDIQGFVSSLGVASFLGIPFATIPARFRQAKPVHLHELTGVLDARTYGPKCPQPPDPPRVMRDHLYAGAPITTTPDDEFSCLRLNIYTSPEAIAHASKLPVLVWIHGGAWLMGDGNADYTGDYLVRHSLDIGKPFIFIGINYRLGYFGCLTSRELKDEALSLGEVGWACQGLFDQRLALQWVQKNIHYFGGDGSNVTIAGESAGGWSVLAHLKSNEPVCQRGIIQSCPSWTFPKAEEVQETFDGLVASAGISKSASASEKLAALRDLPASEMVNLCQGSSPLWDDKWFQHQEPMRLEQIKEFPSWVQGIVVGHMKDEFALFGLQFIFRSKEAIKAAFMSCMDDQEFAAELVETYGISTAVDDATAIEGMIRLCSDGLFNRLPYTMRNATSIPISVYKFAQADTYEKSPFRGQAYHALDNVYTCRMPAVAGKNAQAPLQATSNAFSRMYADFVYGEQPWEDYIKAGRSMVFDGPETGLIATNEVGKWRGFITTKGREEMFSNLTRNLLRVRGKPAVVTIE